MEDKRLEFLYASIEDIQNIIRAVDTKVGFLLVFTGIPINSLGKIYSALSSLYKTYDVLIWKLTFFIYVGLFLLAWFLSFFSAFKALVSIHNPAAHIKSASTNKGTFFRGGLFKHRLIDIFRARSSLKSTLKVDEVVISQPQNVDQLISELVFEQMKLAYIRDMKIFRQNWAYHFALIWLFLGFIGQMASLLFKKNS